MSAAAHGFTGPGDVDPEPNAAYRDANGCRHEAPGAPPMRYASIRDYRKGRSATAEPSAGNGLLDVLVCTAESLDATGVLLLDGVPVAAGDGRYQVDLPPGPHRLGVQGQDGASAEFTLAPGERVHFTTGQGVAVRHQVEFRTQLYRVRDASDFVPVLSQGAASRSGAGCLTAVAGLAVVVGIVIAMQFVDDGGAVGLTLSIIATAAAVALIAGTVVALRQSGGLHKSAKANRLASERVATGAPGPLTGPAVAFPSPQDAREWAAGRRVRGPLVVFDLFLYRLARRADGTVSYTGVGEALALSHAEGIRCLIDGTEVPGDWAAWHYPLAEGEHRFRVEYGAVEDGGAHCEFDVEVPSVDDMAVVHVPVRVFRVWDEPTRSFTALPPRIAHRVTKRAKGIVGKTYVNNGDPDDWVPPRLWPKD
ncbi:hypothetical protein [Glycomyces harbinensis]|uniref:Uncharacterized protein n=1 Tax=Glycomyces harbinensis TaxID=58114 RepID=A0A1G6Y2S4_9ACTN|nr:hypothetical protein [Glycomyces harbinensis]SDD84602.1 hypothetical protein SAMN05216270_10897 [Glycomyces harbinensis]